MAEDPSSLTLEIRRMRDAFPLLFSGPSSTTDGNLSFKQNTRKGSLFGIFQPHRNMIWDHCRAWWAAAQPIKMSSNDKFNKYRSVLDTVRSSDTTHVKISYRLGMLTLHRVAPSSSPALNPLHSKITLTYFWQALGGLANPHTL